jgi:hypothetical protein
MTVIIAFPAPPPPPLPKLKGRKEDRRKKKLTSRNPDMKLFGSAALGSSSGLQYFIT